MLFAESETTWASVAMAVVVLLSQVFLWWRGERLAKENAQRIHNVADQQTGDIERSIDRAAAPLGRKLDTVEKQTNGITERLERTSAEAAEVKAVLNVTAEKLKQYDPTSTVVKVADELLKKQPESNSNHH